MHSILPANASTLERNLSSVIQKRFEDTPVVFNHLSADTADIQFLPFLASEMSVDSWNFLWNENQKRQIINSAFEVHKYKGSIFSLKEQLRSVSVDLQVIEWWQDDAVNTTPHTFTVTASVNTFLDTGQGSLLNENFTNDLCKVIDKVKNARSHYDLQVEVNFASTKYISSNAQVKSLKQFEQQTTNTTATIQNNMALTASIKRVVLADAHVTTLPTIINNKIGMSLNAKNTLVKKDKIINSTKTINTGMAIDIHAKTILIINTII